VLFIPVYASGDKKADTRRCRDSVGRVPKCLLRTWTYDDEFSWLLTAFVIGVTLGGLHWAILGF
jgi:hypothetical protein